jgi:flagellin-specific chaperone FliS
MEIIKAGKKGKHLNTLERYHIHKIGKNNLQLNDTNIDLNNPILEALNEIYTEHTSAASATHSKHR